MRLIVLAAGQGTRLRPLTDERPKCLVEVAGRPILAWQLETASQAGIEQVTVVGGYRSEQLRGCGAAVIDNPAYASTNMVQSLLCASGDFGGGFVASYGDILYDVEVLRALLASPAPIAVVVDRQWLPYWRRRFAHPLDDAESLRTDGQGRIVDIGRRVSDESQIEAQYIGLTAFRGEGVAALRAAVEAAKADERAGARPFGGARPFAQCYMTDLLQGMIDRGHAVSAVPIEGGWVEVDSLRDLEIAEELIAGGRLPSLRRTARVA
jgi:choline kinase